jgi:hypothetical protein
VRLFGTRSAAGTADLFDRWSPAVRSLHEHRSDAEQVSLIHVPDLPVVPPPTT